MKPQNIDGVNAVGTFGLLHNRNTLVCRCVSWKPGTGFNRYCADAVHSAIYSSRYIKIDFSGVLCKPPDKKYYAFPSLKKLIAFSVVMRMTSSRGRFFISATFSAI